VSDYHICIFCLKFRHLISLSIAPFWIIKQRVVVIRYRRFGTTCRSLLRGSKVQKWFWILDSKMGPIGCPETSVKNYHYSLCNNSEERICHLIRGGSQKSHNKPIFSGRGEKPSSPKCYCRFESHLGLWCLSTLYFPSRNRYITIEWFSIWGDLYVCQYNLDNHKKRSMLGCQKTDIACIQTRMPSPDIFFRLVLAGIVSEL
jgi:hypothetical protein